MLAHVFALAESRSTCADWMRPDTKSIRRTYFQLADLGREMAESPSSWSRAYRQCQKREIHISSAALFERY